MITVYTNIKWQAWAFIVWYGNCKLRWEVNQDEEENNRRKRLEATQKYNQE